MLRIVFGSLTPSFATLKWRRHEKLFRTKIANRIKSLEDIDGVTVTPSNEKKTIYVEFKTHRSLDFKFVWSNDHYIGYFLDGEGKQSQAVISIWEPIEAIHFATSYSLLIELRAGRK